MNVQWTCTTTTLDVASARQVQTATRLVLLQGRSAHSKRPLKEFLPLFLMDQDHMSPAIKITGALCLILFFAALGFLPMFERSRVQIIVSNASGAELKDVQIQLSGVTSSVEQLRPWAVFAARVCPTTESHVVIAFTDSAMERHQTNLDVYLEPRFYHGTISAAIKSNNVIRWTNSIRIGFY